MHASSSREELEGQPIKVLELPIIHMIIDNELRIEALNRKGLEEFEISEEPYRGQSLLDLIAIEDRAMVQDYIEVMRTLNQYEQEFVCRMVTSTGTENWYTVQFRKLLTTPDQYFELFLTNETKIKLYEAFLDGEKQVLEAIARNWPLSDTLELLARLMEDNIGGDCTIALLDQDRRLSTRTIMGPTMPPAYMSLLRDMQIGSHEEGIGKLLYDGKSIFVEDFETDETWEDYRTSHLALGIRACWCHPLKNSNNQVVGALVVCYKERQLLSQHASKAIEFLSHLAELAISHNQIRASEILDSETERQTTNKEIEWLLQQNDSILHAAGDGIFGVDLDGYVMFCNQTAAHILGYEIEGLIGKSIQQTLLKLKKGQQVSKRISSIKLSMLEKRKIHTDREEFSHKKGHFLPVEYIAAPIIEKGKVIGTVVTFRDITERRKAEQNRQMKELNFRNQQQILRQLSVQVHDISFKKAIQVISEQSCRVLKVEQTSVWVYSKDIKSYLRQDLFVRNQNKHHYKGLTVLLKDVPLFMKSLKADRVFIFKKRDPRFEEIRLHIPSLKEIGSLLIAPIYSGKHVLGIVSFAEKEEDRVWDYDEQNFATAIADLVHLLLEKEERLKTEELLRKTEKLSLVGELAAGVAHEIRNPLTSLKGFLQLMRERNAESLQKPFYDIMLSEIDRINFISGELLLLAKPQATAFTEIDLEIMCHQVLSLFAMEANLYNIQFDYKNKMEGPETAIVMGDPDQIKQVLVNVIKNGMEAMDAGGWIQVILDLETDGFYHLYIKDHGKGMPRERIERLGEPFYTTKEKGTGLGLMVSYRIVEAHKGFLEVDSQLNIGTTVDIALPKASRPYRLGRNSNLS